MDKVQVAVQLVQPQARLLETNIRAETLISPGNLDKAVAMARPVVVVAVASPNE